MKKYQYVVDIYDRTDFYQLPLNIYIKNLDEYQEIITDHLAKYFGDWFCENQIDYQVDFRQIKDLTEPNTIKIYPFLRFENQLDVMAFKLAWL